VWVRRITTERETRGWNKPQFIEALRGHASTVLPGKESLLRRVHSWESGTCPDDFYKPLIAKTFGTVTAAIVKLAVNPYDVLVLDRDLPGIHGDTICRTITAAGNPVMILMLTAAGTPGDRVTGLALGADDYLPKPFHFPELVLCIHALARRKPAAQPLILRGRDRARPAPPHRHPPRPPHRHLGQRIRRPRDPPQSSARHHQRRRPPRPGLGREHRPVHQDRPGHHQPAPPQTRRPQPIQTIPGVGYRIIDPSHQPAP
jgi:CheY-like chemotaxis protein